MDTQKIAKKIDIKELYKSFDNNSIFEKISFSVNMGDRIALTGGSGVGKTTLLNILAGIDSDYKGKVRNEFSRTVLLPQNNELIDWLTVEKIIQRTINFSKISFFESEEIINNFCLKNIFNQKYSVLSGGQKRIVFLAVSLLSKPDLLLLDEAFNGIDKQRKKYVLKFIDNWIKNKDITLIVVSHIKSDLDYLVNKEIKLFRKKIFIEGWH